MLQAIYLKNFIIIDQLELEFSSGMSVLTGETGAGKSIIIDALELVLGARLPGNVLKNKEKACEINVVFDLGNNQAAKAWLQKHALDSNHECILRRSINADGRSKGFINGNSATLQMLQQLGSLLVNIHGQHEHQSLLKHEAQKTMLDSYAGLKELASDVKTAYKNWYACFDKLKALKHQACEQSTQLEFLRYQLQEFKKLNLTEGEIETLFLEHKQLANADTLLAHSDTVLALLQQTDTDLVKVLHLLTAMKAVDPRFAGSSELIESAQIQINEATSDINHCLNQIELDPNRLQWIDERLSAIHNLARKHRVKAEKLFNVQINLQENLDTLDNADLRLESLEKELKLLEQEYISKATVLSKKRQSAAKKLSLEVTANMQQLGMPGGQFQVALTHHLDKTPRVNGLESIEFLVSANPGQKLATLSKVASGGELSRISLAIQVLIAKNIATPTLIFDEVDVGIGGKTAAMVGKRLRQLGENTQVFCVTHLPQVAAFAHHHFQVTKSQQQNNTITQVQALLSEDKIDEIARMLGGVNITEQTRAHATEMLKSSLD